MTKTEDLSAENLRLRQRVAKLEEQRTHLEYLIKENAERDEEREKERDFAESLVQTAQAIVLVLDPEGRVVRFNPYMEELSGYTLEEVKGKDWFSTFLPFEDHGKIRDVFRKTVAETIIDGNINPILTKDGSEKDIIWYGKTLRSQSGELWGVLAIGYDITEQKRIEERLRQSEKMEAIGHLAGGIAHDFNNILSGIIGYTDLTLDSVRQGSMAEENLRQVLSAAERAKHLVHQILTFSRKTIEKKEVMFLYAIVRDALNFLKATIPSTITIKKDLKRDTKAVYAEPIKLHEVLVNLSTNAVYAMNERGTLSIRLYETTAEEEIQGNLGSTPPGDYSVIEVSDTGCGMNVETQHRIFEPFFTTKPVGQGTGMGLSVVFGIVKDHEGNIQVESDLGEGSTFRVFLPKTEAETETDEKLLSLLPAGTERVLFVDDEKSIIKIVSEMLDSLGYRVQATSSSAEALEWIRENPDGFDLLITDQTMPEMTGTELAREALDIRRDLPIILCTGFSNVVSPETALAMGISKFCMKPITRRELSKAIREVLES